MTTQQTGAYTDKTPSFTCPKCGMTSFNPNDIRERYCGNCHEFFPKKPYKPPHLIKYGDVRGMTEASFMGQRHDSHHHHGRPLKTH